MIAHLIEVIVGVIRPVNPLEWPAHVRHLRTSEGWVPPMMIIAAGVLLLGLEGGLGLFAANPLVVALKLVALVSLLVVALLASLAAFIDSIHNVGRLGVLGLSRPRWWFELARASWIALLLIIVLEIVTGPRIRFLAEVRMGFGGFLFATFLLVATVGYALSAMNGWRRRGRAYECVHYFYVSFGPIAVVMTIVIGIPARAGWAGPATVALAIAAASIMAIAVITIAKRMKDRTMISQSGYPADDMRDAE